MKFYIFYCLLIVFTFSACPTFTYLNSSNCLPCGVRCSTCNNNTNCLTCADGHYLTNNSICLPCLTNCKKCNNSTQCLTCYSLYILSNNSTSCQICLIKYASSCTGLNNASVCLSSYYTQQSYCSPCVLNCQTCINSTNCVTCNKGYLLQYQNSVCSFCSGCQYCNSTLTNCTACWNGYYLSINTNTGQMNCVASSCNITNCLYCSVDSTCTNCNQYYYLVNNTCVFGSSILCDAGAIGTWPSMCTINCSSNYYRSSSTQNNFSCIPYQTINSNTINQFYYYMFDDYSRIFSNSILMNQCKDQSYIASPGDLILNLSNFYKIRITIKGYNLISTSNILNITLSANGVAQLTSINLTSNCNIFIKQINSIQLHYNSINVSFGQNANFGLIEIFLQAYLCSSNCISCLNSELCLVCISTLYQFQYKCISDCLNLYRLNQSNQLYCVQMCPSGYYNYINNNSQNYCQSCILPCLTCSSNNTCFSCTSVNSIPYYYLSNNNTCVSTCPFGQYASNSVCYNCISPCLSCINQVSCLSCVQGYWNGTSCTNQCPSGYFGNTEDNKCDLCNSTCLTCIISAIYCTSCSNSTILFENQCLSACLSGYYLFNNLCARCVAPCKQCASSIICLSCSIGYLYNNSCLSSCPSAFYANPTTQTCNTCNASCSACSSLTFCISCVTGYCLQMGICQNSSINCISSYYQQFINNICTCVSCAYPCNTCTSQLQCTSCLVNYLYNNTCILYCPSNYYGNSTNQICVLCNSTFSNCLQCSSSNCTQCSSGYILNPFSNLLFCVLICPAGFYNNSGTCNYCVTPCATCSNQTFCLTCLVNYTFFSNQCLTQCPTGYYISNSSCLMCNSPCSTCSTSTNCYSCIRSNFINTQTYLHNSSCLSICPSGYYPESITLQCHTCVSPCLTCNTSSICLSCLIGFLINNKCQQCSFGTYANSTSNICMKCSSNCYQCINSTYCNYCSNQYYLYNNSCLSASQCLLISGYFLLNSSNICQLCHSPCITCNSTSYCTSCLTGYLLYNNSCIILCPTGYFNNNSTCIQCDLSCNSCISSSLVCLSCANNYYYYQNQYKCLLTCPSKTYISGYYCLNCIYPCSQCTSQTSCISCQNGVLFNSSCLITCPSTYYSNDELKCITCDSNCFQCSRTAINCTQCLSNYLYNNTCIQNCPDLYYPDNSVSTCFLCITPCLFCTDQITCTKCNTSFIYYKNQNSCITECPNSYFNTSNPNNTINDSKYICQSCLSICLTCINAYSCLLCKSGYSYLNTCISNCPSGMYGALGICLNCTLPCLQCSSSTVCISCPKNQGYLLVGDAQCIISTICPSSYYLIPNSTNCTLNCPNGLYKQVENSICSSTCQDNYFKGSDFVCYESCPTNYYGNSSYFCTGCLGTCPVVLNFQFYTEIINDNLFLTIKFTLAPIFTRAISKNDIVLIPQIPFEINSLSSQKIILLLKPNNSIINQYMSVNILNSFHIFSNQLPLQNPIQQKYFQGYDLYPTSLSNLEILGNIFSIILVLSQLLNGYFGIDFAQIIFFFNLINIHYPSNLRTFLDGFRSSHMYIKILEVNGYQYGKFKTSVSNMSLFGNTLYIFIIFAVYISLLGIILLIRNLSEYMHRNKVQDQNNMDTIVQQQLPLFKKCQKPIKIIKNILILRLIYFFYGYLTLFSICELFNFNMNDPTYSLFSRYLSIITFLVVSIIPGALMYINFDEKPTILSLILIRKYIICLCIVVAINYPLYIIGFICVSSICSMIFIIAFRPYQFKPQEICYIIGQFMQFCITIMIVEIAFWGDGNHTQGKIQISYVLIAFICSTCILYTGFNIFISVLQVLKVIKGKDYIQEWTKKEKQQQSNNDESQNDMVSDIKMKKDQMTKENQQDNHQWDMSQNKKEAEANSKESDGLKLHLDVISDEISSNHFDAPQVLVKVVNKFEDFEKIEDHL